MVLVTTFGFLLTVYALKREFDQRRMDASMKVGASSEKTSMSQVRTTYTNGNDAPIYNVEVVVSFILGSSEQKQRFAEPMVHPGTHHRSWEIDSAAVVTNTEIRFTDGHAHQWSRTQQGVFQDLGVIEFGA